MRCVALRCVALRCVALRCGALRCGAWRGGAFGNVAVGVGAFLKKKCLKIREIERIRELDTVSIHIEFRHVL